METTSIRAALVNTYFNSDKFTLKKAVQFIKGIKEVNEESVRARIYEGVNKGVFERCSDSNGKIIRGVFKVVHNETTTLLVQGNGRDLSFIEDNSIDAIVTDHPYKDDKAHKGGNRNFTNEYECFQYTIDDFREKFRVLKDGAFLVEMLPEESETNFEYLYNIKKMAIEAGFKYYSKVPWEKGSFISNTGRKSKSVEDVAFFTKNESRSLRDNAKKNKATAILHNLDIKGLDANGIKQFLEQNGLPLSYMKGTNGMLPTKFVHNPPSKKERIHQAEKPVTLYQEILSYIAKKGEIILDMFTGSGAFGEAAMSMGMNSILVEINEENIEKIQNRFKNNGYELALQ